VRRERGEAVAVREARLRAAHDLRLRARRVANERGRIDAVEPALAAVAPAAAVEGRLADGDVRAARDVASHGVDAVRVDRVELGALAVVRAVLHDPRRLDHLGRGVDGQQRHLRHEGGPRRALRRRRVGVGQRQQLLEERHHARDGRRVVAAAICPGLLALVVITPV